MALTKKETLMNDTRLIEAVERYLDNINSDSIEYEDDLREALTAVKQTPDVCPTCGSNDPRYAGYASSLRRQDDGPCPDPFHKQTPDVCPTCGSDDPAKPGELHRRDSQETVACFDAFHSPPEEPGERTPEQGERDGLDVYRDWAKRSVEVIPAPDPQSESWEQRVWKEGLRNIERRLSDPQSERCLCIWDGESPEIVPHHDCPHHREILTELAEECERVNVSLTRGDAYALVHAPEEHADFYDALEELAKQLRRVLDSEGDRNE